jgi:hypothetical protein
MALTLVVPTSMPMKQGRATQISSTAAARIVYGRPIPHLL